MSQLLFRIARAGTERLFQRHAGNGERARARRVPISQNSVPARGRQAGCNERDAPGARNPLPALLTY